MNLEWTCTLDNGTICEWLNGTVIVIKNASPILIIPKGTVPGDVNYTFTLKGAKDIRKAKYSIRIEMMSTLTPLVGIDNPPLILNRNQPNVFNLRVFSRMPDSI